MKNITTPPVIPKLIHTRIDQVDKWPGVFLFNTFNYGKS